MPVWRGFLCWLVAATAAGCSAPESPNKPGAGADRRPTPGFPLTVTDVLGRRVTLERPPRRIVSLAPRNTEIVFALGAGDRVVGVTEYCNFPPEAASRTSVGGFSGPTVNLEAVLGLRPDLVLSAGNLHEPLIERLESLGLTVVALYAENFDEMFRELELVGRLTEREQDAQRLGDRIRKQLQSVQERARSIPPSERQRVIYVVADEPLMAAGPASFIGKLIENAGAENIFSDVAQAYPQISEEAVLAREPQIVLAPSSLTSAQSFQRMLQRPAWAGLPAVRAGRIAFLDEDLLSRCGPRSGTAQLLVARAIYPEYFDGETNP